MKIKWYGHAAFLITSDQGIKIITDPFDKSSLPPATEILLLEHAL